MALETDDGKSKRIYLFERFNFWQILAQFLLTTLVGYLLLFLYKEEESRRLLVDASFEQVTGFLTTAVERREKGNLVRSSISRAAPIEELVARKSAYDESYVAFNARYLDVVTGLRGGFGSENKTLHECAIERYLVNWFRKFDGCLTDAYQAAIRWDAEPAFVVGGLTFPPVKREGDVTPEDGELGTADREGLGVTKTVPPSVGSPLAAAPRLAYPDVARQHLSGCWKSMLNPKPGTVQLERHPTYPAREIAKQLRRCTTEIAEQITNERIRRRGFIADSHDTLWAREDEQLAKAAAKLDEACGWSSWRALFPKDQSFQEPLYAYCSAQRAQ